MSGGRLGWGGVGTHLTKYGFVTSLQANAHVQQTVLDLMTTGYDVHTSAGGCNE